MAHYDDFLMIDTDRFSAEEDIDAQLSRAIASLRLSAGDEERFWAAAETFTDEEILLGTTISIPRKSGDSSGGAES